MRVFLFLVLSILNIQAFDGQDPFANDPFFRDAANRHQQMMSGMRSDHNAMMGSMFGGSTGAPSRSATQNGVIATQPTSADNNQKNIGLTTGNDTLDCLCCPVLGTLNCLGGMCKCAKNLYDLLLWVLFA